MPAIRDSFAGRTVLLTGATGFLGKALLEKVLRDLPEVGRLYMLVRPRRRKDGAVQGAMERLRREIFETSIFARLRQAHGERFWSFIEEKVVPLEGDLMLKDAGLSPEDTARLRRDADIIIHGAASVFFDERIDHAVQMNTLGPRRLVELARTFDKPAIFTFVSTCYVSGRRTGRIPEQPPDPRQSAAQANGEANAPGLDVAREIAEIEAFTREVLAEATSAPVEARLVAWAERAQKDGAGEPVEALVEEARERHVKDRLVREGMRRARRLGWHDVYTFSKAMGEALVVSERGPLPVAIVRPSIIESSLAEPEPGWINGLKVADPLIAGYAKGRIPDFPGKPGAVLDIIPVDFVANAILAATARLDRDRQLAVYHVATGARNPARVSDLFRLMQQYYRRHPMRDKRGEPIRVGDWSFPSAARFRAKYRFGYQLPLEAASAVIRATSFLPWPDGLGERLGHGAQAVERLLYYTDIYSPYTSLDCRFESDRTAQLFAELEPDDRRRFNFDVSSIAWPVYMQDVHLSGLDRHVLRFGRSDDAGRGRSKRGGAAVRLSTEDLRTLPDLLRITALRFGDKTALQVKRDGAWARLSYAELLERSGLMGTLWRREGLSRGDRVVLIAENLPEWAVAYFAGQCAGATVVPIDTHTPLAEIEQIVAFTQARAVLTSRAQYGSLPKALRSSPLPIWDITNQGLPFEERGLPAPPLPARSEVSWSELSPDDVASIIFTSGPAVEPRGAMLTHRNFLSNLLSLSEALRSYQSDRFVSVLPLHHALEFTGGLLMPLFSGAMVTYAPTLKSKVILDLMEETGATALLAVPRIFEMLLDRLRRGDGEGGEKAARSPELTSFVNRTRLLVSGGAPLDYSIYEAFAELGTPIHEGYGLTETAPILTVNPQWAIRPRSVGKPLPGVELRLDRPDDTGEGEIVVRGPNVMKGYFGNPEATARMLRDGWLYTGDLGRLDADGYLTITGRSKELIVTGAGKNVWPEEVELFYRDLPGVREMAVFGVRDQGATRETVHAAVVAEGDPETVLESIHRVSHERPSYQRLSQVHFWDRPLPRSAETGRVDRKALRAEAIERIRAAKRSKRAVAAETRPTAWWEAETRRLLARVVNRPPEEPFGRREALAQLLDSLQSVELLAALEGRFGLTLPDEEATHLRTVGDLLDRVQAAVGSREEPVRPATAEGEAAGDYWSRTLAQAAAPGPEAGTLRASPAMLPAQTLFLGGASLLMRTAWRLRVEGLHNLPRGRPFLIAANHQSHLDSGAIIAALGGRVRRIHLLGARDYFFATPTAAWFFRNFLNVVPFDRDKNFAAGLRSCRAVLGPDEPVLIFPEGTRSTTGRLQPFKVGLGILALELDAAVLPACIRGTYEAFPKGARLPRPSRIEVSFGEPVTMERYQERRAGESVYDLYREIVNEVRQRIDQMSV